ncbi:hypothetical protein CCP4SC76_1080001 [Gammaproteobacteria bacterium]
MSQKISDHNLHTYKVLCFLIDGFIVFEVTAFIGFAIRTDLLIEYKHNYSPLNYKFTYLENIVDYSCS